MQKILRGGGGIPFTDSTLPIYPSIHFSFGKIPFKFILVWKKTYIFIRTPWVVEIILMLKLEFSELDWMGPGYLGQTRGNLG